MSLINASRICTNDENVPITDRIPLVTFVSSMGAITAERSQMPIHGDTVGLGGTDLRSLWVPHCEAWTRLCGPCPRAWETGTVAAETSPS